MKVLPYLALACAALGGVLLNLPRWLYASGEIEPGDDTPFNLLLSAPAVLLVGVIIAFVARARGWGSRGAANAALALNGGVLVLLIAVAVFGIATYNGR